MSIAPLIARGVGFNPGSVRYIPTLGLGVGAAVPTISVNPASVPAGQTTTVTVTGTNTTWTSTAPSFSLSGVAGLSVLSTTVLSDTSATVQVQAGSASGTATLTDATSGASCPLGVTPAAAPVVPFVAPTGLIESDGAKGGYLVPTQYGQIYTGDSPLSAELYRPPALPEPERVEASEDFGSSGGVTGRVLWHPRTHGTAAGEFGVSAVLDGGIAFRPTFADKMMLTSGASGQWNIVGRDYRAEIQRADEALLMALELGDLSLMEELRRG